MKKLDSTKNRWNPKLLVEEIRTGAESIKEGIQRAVRGYRNCSNLTQAQK